MSVRANNWINAGLKPLEPHQWLYWDIQYIIGLYEDIKQDWSLTDADRREEIEEGIRYKYGKLAKAIDDELIDLPVQLKDVPKLKSFLLEMKETANEQMEFMLDMDFNSRDDLNRLADLYHRMDTVIGGAANIAERFSREEELKKLSGKRKKRFFKK